jgi:hypothetical protein
METITKIVDKFKNKINEDSIQQKKLVFPDYAVEFLDTKIFFESEIYLENNTKKVSDKEKNE